MAAIVACVMHYIASKLPGKHSVETAFDKCADGSGCCGAAGCRSNLSPEADAAVGFARKEMGARPTAGTVAPYRRHIFCAAGPAAEWPAKGVGSSPAAVELQRLMGAVLRPRRVWLTCRTPPSV